MSSFYRRFIPNFSKIASPLQSLTCKDVQFVWTEECARAFQILKEKLTSAPVLSYPTFEKSFILETDASMEGLGAVLFQSQDDGLLHPVTYDSCSLTPAERNYSITELGKPSQLCGQLLTLWLISTIMM